MLPYAALAIMATLMAGAPASAPVIDVTETAGTYTVWAEFAVTQPAEAVITVLTDYERIPRYMPDVESSTVLERSAGGALVEQAAVSRFMMFSKRVHLVLDVVEEGLSVRFRDRCGKSFTLYEGTWTVAQHDGIAVVGYALTAKPSFEVPGFVLKRLLKRDAGLMIERLRAEIARRATERE